jgi:hypothetical protein
MTLGKLPTPGLCSPFIPSVLRSDFLTPLYFRLLDKIAKDIMVCENKTVRRWDGSIGQYKNHLRKKMLSSGQV